MSPPVFPPLNGKSLKDERRTFNKFKTSLGEFHVLHSLDLPSYSKKNQEKGEADFVVLAPNKGIFIIEVKGGGLEFKNGQWFSVLGSSKRKINSPHEQAENNAFEIRKKLRNAFPHINGDGFTNTLITWGSVFPSQAYNAVGSEFEDEKWRVWDANSFYHDIKEFINLLHIKQIEKLKKIDRKFKLPSKNEIEKYTKFLRRDFECPKLLRVQGDAIDKKIHKYTEDQLETLDALDGNNRIVIRGGAGTGKTLLAADVIRRQIQKNKNPLFLCYNKEITTKVQSMMLEEGYYHLYNTYPTIKTWHQFLSNSLLLEKSAIDDLQKKISFSNWASKTLAKTYIERINQLDKIIQDASKGIDDKYIVKYTFKMGNAENLGSGTFLVEDNYTMESSTKFKEFDELRQKIVGNTPQKMHEPREVYNDIKHFLKQKYLPDSSRYEFEFKDSKIFIFDKVLEIIQILIVGEKIKDLRKIHLSVLDDLKNNYLDKFKFTENNTLEGYGFIYFTKQGKRFFNNNVNQNYFSNKKLGPQKSISVDLGIISNYKTFFEVNVDWGYSVRKTLNPYAANLSKDDIIERIENDIELYSSKEQIEYFNTLNIEEYFKTISPKHKYDIIVVDESQDIIANRVNLNCIHLTVKGGIQNGKWNFFLDPMQFSSSFNDGIKDGIQVYKKIKSNLEEVILPHYHTLITNCRNTKEIANSMFKICDIQSGAEELGMKYKVNDEIESGINPNFIYYDENEQIPEIINDILKPLKKEKIPGKDIQILSMDNNLDDRIKQADKYFDIFSVDNYGYYKNSIGKFFGSPNDERSKFLHFVDFFDAYNYDWMQNYDEDKQTIIPHTFSHDSEGIFSLSFNPDIIKKYLFAQYLDKNQSDELIKKLKDSNNDSFALPENIEKDNFLNSELYSYFNIQQPKWISFHEKFFKEENGKSVVDIDEIKKMASIENWYKEFNTSKRVCFDSSVVLNDNEFNPLGDGSKIYNGAKLVKGFYLSKDERTALNERGKLGRLSKSMLEWYTKNGEFKEYNIGSIDGSSFDTFVSNFSQACEQYKHFNQSTAKHSSVYKFRGMDQKYITLVGLHSLKPRDFQALYIGMSRAKVKLDIICHSSLEQGINEILNG